MATRKKPSPSATPAQQEPNTGGVTQGQAEEAVRTLLLWAGEDPKREGLRDTPTRVVRAYRDWFSSGQKMPLTELTELLSNMVSTYMPTEV